MKLRDKCGPDLLQRNSPGAPEWLSRDLTVVTQSPTWGSKLGMEPVLDSLSLSLSPPPPLTYAHACSLS